MNGDTGLPKYPKTRADIHNQQVLPIEVHSNVEAAQWSE
jgi:hypothetical protein